MERCRTNVLGGILALLLALAVDALGANRMRQPIYDVEEHAVLSIVIDTLCYRPNLFPGELFLLLRDAECHDCTDLSRYMGYSRTMAFLVREAGSDTLEICADLENKCSRGGYWALDFRTKTAYVWKDSAGLRAAMHTQVADQPVIILSRVGFNDGRTKALCYVTVLYGGRSGGTYLVYLDKSSGTWNVRSYTQIVTA